MRPWSAARFPVRGRRRPHLEALPTGVADLLGVKTEVGSVRAALTTAWMDRRRGRGTTALAATVPPRERVRDRATTARC